MIAVRPEGTADLPHIRALLEAAFPTVAEARLVDALRAGNRLVVSLVAEEASAVVGHIALSPVEVQSVGGSFAGLGLAPVAVLPGAQRRGIGSRLVRLGLANARALGTGFAVVLGEPAYYGRFGFEPASRWSLTNTFGAGDEFMARELHPGALRPGLVRYAPEFELVG